MDDKNFLTEQAEDALSVQSYEKTPVIDGVVMKELRTFVDDGGSFMELLRLSQGISEHFPEFEVKQVNFSQVLPTVIKAFHLHLHQEDVWFIPPHERLLVVLTDQRKDSATQGVTMRMVMGAGKAQLLYIPRGVAHGNANLWSNPASLVYFVNQQFNPTDPDEGRLPWDFLGKEIWEITKG